MVYVSHRIGHDYQWTNSKAANTAGPGSDSISASWKCPITFDVHGSPKALHLGVYAAQPSQGPELVDRSSSFLSVVSPLCQQPCALQSAAVQGGLGFSNACYMLRPKLHVW